MTQSSLPAPSMTMADIASRLGLLWGEMNSAQITTTSLADGITWENLKGDLVTRAGNLYDLAIQVTEHANQEAQVAAWVVQAQNSIQSMQAQIASLQARLAACGQAEATPHVATPVAAAIAVGTAALGGILGFVGGRTSAGSRWWPWSK